MSDLDRKALARQYKETRRPMGIYRVRNISTGKSLVGTSTDLPGMLNRQRFQLQGGLHPDKELQKDWVELGSENFAFEVLDQLQPKEDPTVDPSDDLSILKDIWLEKLAASGDTFYPMTKQIVSNGPP